MSVTGSGTAAGTFSTHLGLTPASGRWLLTGEESLESAGLKVVSSVLDLEANGTFRTSSLPIPFLLSVQNTTTFRFFDDPWRFPAEIGNTSVVTGQMNFSEDSRLFYGFQNQTHTAGRVWWNVSYALETAIAVDSPAGHFDAYRIRETTPDGSYAQSYYAPATGNDARTESYNGTSRVATNELVSYRYQALEPRRFLRRPPVDRRLIAVDRATDRVSMQPRPPVNLAHRQAARRGCTPREWRAVSWSWSPRS